MPYDKQRYEVDNDKFEIQEGPALGCGEFGRVCQGQVETQLGTIKVAVKTANPEKIRKTTLNGLLMEIKVLAHLGKHENVAELIGANTVGLKDGKVFIFLELCQLGSLEKYLRKLRPEVDGEMEEEFYSAYQSSSESIAFSNNRYVNMVAMGEEGTLDQELSSDLYKWSKDICNGMAYLASKHVVHADLATRNVLLNLRKEAKLCDFGLSRRLYSYTSYVKKHQEPLPWKWMSPEALKLLEFNEKSDVWAYGVTLWEIYSLGDTPYLGFGYNLNFSVLLEQGFRLNKPKYNDKNM